MLHFFTVFALTSIFAAPVQTGVLPAASSSAAMHSEAALKKAEILLEEAKAAYQRVNGYTAIFLKQERIRKKLRKEEKIELKFRKPFHVYMLWQNGPDKGMEIIFKEGENNNKMTAHLGGFLNHVTPRLNLDIEDRAVRRNNRHLITETGIGVFLKQYEADYLKAKKAGEVHVMIHGKEKFFGEPVLKVEAVLPEDPQKGYYCYRSVVYFHEKHKLPVQMEFYDFDNQLIEKYGYKNLKINPGLTGKDFDPDNEAYDF